MWHLFWVMSFWIFCLIWNQVGEFESCRFGWTYFPTKQFLWMNTPENSKKAKWSLCDGVSFNVFSPRGAIVTAIPQHKYFLRYPVPQDPWDDRICTYYFTIKINLFMDRSKYTCNPSILIRSYPRCSMHGIFTYIYPLALNYPKCR